MSVCVIDADRATYESLANDFPKVQWFGDAETFLGQIDGSGAPVVVVANMHLPGMDGVELVRQLRARQLAARVILLGENADVATAVDAIREGAADFLEKPLSSGRLRRCVHRLLRSGTRSRSSGPAVNPRETASIRG